MKAEQVCKLQENLAKEAIAYLMLYGTAVDVTPYRKAVTQVGMAWGLPIPDTQRWLDLIRQEEIAVAQAANPEKVNHVMEEKDLPINASGLQTLDNIWGLFETAVELNSAAGRRDGLDHQKPDGERGGPGAHGLHTELSKPIADAP